MRAMVRTTNVFATFAGIVGLVACAGSPASSMNPTAPSGMAAGGAASVSPMQDDDPDPDPLSGRFTGGGFQINANDVKVTRGFTLHCDAILSNNFEVNWSGGNRFHIDKNPTDVTCTRTGVPNPPAADANRIEIKGTGKLNGVAGAAVHLVLIDNGEPGRNNDRAYISINGGAALSVGGSAAAPATIDGGNIQAHFDQPHR